MLAEIEKFKLAVISDDQFTDEEIKKLFLRMIVSSEEDIDNVIEILEKYRPRVVESLATQYMT